jgi:hypothetical protein
MNGNSATFGNWRMGEWSETKPNKWFERLEKHPFGGGGLLVGKTEGCQQDRGCHC